MKKSLREKLLQSTFGVPSSIELSEDTLEIMESVLLNGRREDLVENINRKLNLERKITLERGATTAYTHGIDASALSTVLYKIEMEYISQNTFFPFVYAVEHGTLAIHYKPFLFKSKNASDSVDDVDNMVVWSSYIDQAIKNTAQTSIPEYERSRMIKLLETSGIDSSAKLFELIEQHNK